MEIQGIAHYRQGQIHGGFPDPMFRSDWRKFAKVVGLGLAGLVAYLFVLFVGYQIGVSAGYFDAQADRYAAQYPGDTDQRIDHCFAEAQPSEQAQDCIREAVESSHESQRSERDLTAQREMSKWAFWLLVVTLGQVPLTIVGLVFLLRTIWQGQEALGHARGASYKELRAYVYPGIFNVRHKEVEEMAVFEIDLPLKNSGQTPATDLKVWMGAMAVPYPLPRVLPDVFDRLPICFHAIGPAMERGVIARCILDNLEWDSFNDGQAAVIFRLRYTYLTYEDEEIVGPCYDMWTNVGHLPNGKMNVVSEQHTEDAEGETPNLPFEAGTETPG